MLRSTKPARDDNEQEKLHTQLLSATPPRHCHVTARLYNLAIAVAKKLTAIATTELRKPNTATNAARDDGNYNTQRLATKRDTLQRYTARKIDVYIQYICIMVTYKYA